MDKLRRRRKGRARTVRCSPGASGLKKSCFRKRRLGLLTKALGRVAAATRAAAAGIRSLADAISSAGVQEGSSYSLGQTIRFEGRTGTVVKVTAHEVDVAMDDGGSVTFALPW